MLNFPPLFLTELNNQIEIQTTQTPETVKGHGCDRCEQESHLLGIMYKMELMGWEAEGLRLADVSRNCACYWHSCHLGSSFHPSAGIDRGSPLLCNMTQMMDLLSRNVRAHAHRHIEGKHTLSLDTCTHTHTLVLSAAAVICHLDPYQLLSKSAHILFYLTSVGRGDFVRSCKWDPDMQKSCWIKSAGQARPFTG